MQNGSYTGIGLMSGSSLDGLDIALCRFTRKDGEWQFAILAAETEPLPEEWQQRLTNLPAASALELAQAHAGFGHWLGMTVRRFAVLHDAKPEWVASHGHTIFHQPDRQFTFQLGCSEALASHISAPVVANFRAKDVALGGQGAPLVPFAEWHLFPDYELFLNLGGIANLSVLPRTPERRAQLANGTWKGRPLDFLGWDVCGCNQLLNPLANAYSPEWKYDPDGQTARVGTLAPALLDSLLALPYAFLPPPKSLGNEDVRSTEWSLLATYVGSIPDGLHTAVAYIARRVADEFARLGIANAPLLVTGGGAHNGYMMQVLTESLAPFGIVPQLPVPALIDFKEAVAFAFLGLQTLYGQPNTLPGATGARQAVCGGTISYGC